MKGQQKLGNCDEGRRGGGESRRVLFAGCVFDICCFDPFISNDKGREKKTSNQAIYRNAMPPS